MSDEAAAGQYHFDPATYLDMMLAEVPAYPRSWLNSQPRRIGLASLRMRDNDVAERARAQPRELNHE